MRLALTHEQAWPTCYYDASKLCGDRGHDTCRDSATTSWHVAAFCDCPSCPLRVAIAEAIRTTTQL